MRVQITASVHVIHEDTRSVMCDLFSCRRGEVPIERIGVSWYYGRAAIVVTHNNRVRALCSSRCAQLWVRANIEDGELSCTKYSV